MENNYEETHVNSQYDEDMIEINPEYVYLTIPADYVCVYHKLLIYMADFGKTIIDDCQAVCKGSSKNIITCWNLFQSAIACHSLGQEKEAAFFIDYIKKQLDNIYRGSDDEAHNSSIPVAITEDGKLKAVVSCENEIHFYVDIETGKLYQKYLDEKGDKVYAVEDDNLLVKYKEDND